MDQVLKRSKAIVRSWMAANYTDDRLAQLLDHAWAGKLSYGCCCCFIGIVTADHELKSAGGTGEHYGAATGILGALEAEAAFFSLGIGGYTFDVDEERRTRLIPIVKAEIRRRMAVQMAVVEIQPENVTQDV